MTHEEIKEKEVVERYVGGALAEDEKLAFEEHFFACDHCFDQVQTMERFVAGIHYAAESGLLAASSVGQDKIAPFWLRWMRPAFALASAASLALAAAVFWLLLYQAPRLRGELARERTERAQTEQQLREGLDETEEQLRIEREERARLEARLQQQPHKGDENSSATAALDANLPLAMLDATRSGEAGEIVIPRASRNVVLWIEAGEKFRSFRVEIYSAEGRLVQRVEGARPNPYGAIAISLPSRLFQRGRYLVKLLGVSDGILSPAGEYSLQVLRR